MRERSRDLGSAKESEICHKRSLGSKVRMSEEPFFVFRFPDGVIKDFTSQLKARAEASSSEHQQVHHVSYIKQ